MTLVIRTTAATGLTLVATAKRRSDNYYWDDATDQAWEAAPSFADKSITLTEGSGDYIGTYTGSPAASLGTEDVDIFIHDTGNSNLVIGQALYQLLGGEEWLRQHRGTRDAGKAFRFELSNRRENAYKCTETMRPQPGSVGSLLISIDTSPLFGKDRLVSAVGTCTISSGSLTATAVGPYDTKALFTLGGTATADEEVFATIPITMEDGQQIDAILDIATFSTIAAGGAGF